MLALEHAAVISSTCNPSCSSSPLLESTTSAHVLTDTVRGAIGTAVTLAIKRPGSSEAVSVSLTRQPTAKLTGPGITPAKQRTVSADGDKEIIK